MDVKQAVRAAKAYAADLFEGEELRLEEVWFDEEEGQWCVTVGLLRSEPPSKVDLVLNNKPKPHFRMHYKTVRIDDDTEKIVSLRNHERMPVAPLTV
ncbi:MAG: hypothetical protein ACR2PI_19520 [Hyphomicrobiaceae bacterium]